MRQKILDTKRKAWQRECMQDSAKAILKFYDVMMEITKIQQKRDLAIISQISVTKGGFAYQSVENKSDTKLQCLKKVYWLNTKKFRLICDSTLYFHHPLEKQECHLHDIFYWTRRFTYLDCKGIYKTENLVNLNSVC